MSVYYVATKTEESQIKAYLAKRKKSLQEMGFRWIRSFKSESKAILWLNESYLHHEKFYLY
jgi:hypothetical protein